MAICSQQTSPRAARALILFASYARPAGVMDLCVGPLQHIGRRCEFSTISEINALEFSDRRALSNRK